LRVAAKPLQWQFEHRLCEAIHGACSRSGPLRLVFINLAMAN
jgi:hypothetical protein